MNNPRPPVRHGIVVQVTPPTAPTPHDAIAAAVRAAFQSGTHPCPTSGVISAATELLEALWAAAAQKGVEPRDFDTLYGELAPVVLQAQIEAFRRRHDPDLAPDTVLAEAIRAAGRHLGQDVKVVEGPSAYSEGPGAYAVIQRVPQTPPWGPGGDLNLVVHLRHDDGVSTSNTWEWTAHPDVPGGTSHHITIIAPPPSHASAAEVGERLAGVLSGSIKAWPASGPPVGQART